MIKEFKEFAMKGNVMDMAVGIIIGAGFGKIVSSLVNDIIMPPIGLLMGNVDFSELSYEIAAEGADGEPVVIKYGQFVNTVLDFVIIAFVIFLFIKQMNRLKSKEPDPTPTEKKCPKCLLLVPIEASRCGHCTSEI
ncbi:large-conductance mechanosensitive channel protein MscL [Polystyrenella longa]